MQRINDLKRQKRRVYINRKKKKTNSRMTRWQVQISLRISLRVSQVPDTIMGHFIPLRLFCVTKMQAQQRHRERHIFYIFSYCDILWENQERKSAVFPPELL